MQVSLMWVDDELIIMVVVTYAANNTYKALRLISKTYNLYYAVWCTNEHELYDLTARPPFIPLSPFLPSH